MKNKSIIIVGVLVSIIIIICIVVAIIIANNKNGKNSKNINTNNNMENNEIINTINNNSKLPVNYMEQYDNEDVKLQRYNKLDNFMSKDFKDNDISFSYYGYPNDESDLYLGKIELLTNKYNILGVTIGDNYKKAIEKIESYGFNRTDIPEEDDIYEAKLNYKDINIVIKTKYEINLGISEDISENDIGSIEISIESDYLGNRLY